MTAVLTYVHVLAAGLLIGKVLLLSAVVAPILAKELAPPRFSQVVRRLFPAYYAMGVVASGLGLAAVVGLAFLGGWSAGVTVALCLWSVVAAAESYCGSVLTPQSNAMRDEMKRHDAKGTLQATVQSAWARLHRRSLWLNTMVLMVGCVVLGVALQLA
ncbi:MAG: DUF4149 domain-containing protein [Nitrospiraceae bacterium]